MATDDIVDPGAEAAREDGDTFAVKPRSIGLLPGLSYDCISDLISMGEGEESR